MEGDKHWQGSIVAWQRIGPRIVLKRPLGELRAAFARADLVALDLDECIFPGISQEALGVRIARLLARKPLRAGDRRFLPRLVLGGFYRAWTHARGLAGLPTPVPRLVAWYGWAMRGIPEEYFIRAASRLPKHSFPCAAETIALLAEHAPTGIVSLGLDVVARAYAEQFPGLSFYEANRTLFRPGPAGQRVFEGYDRAAALFSGEDKRRALERRLAERASDAPAPHPPAPGGERRGGSVAMVVGHNDDDVPMARLARERGGLAVGFNPPARLWEEFDAVATGPDWESLYALVAILSFGSCS